jgi:hypothetical protein
MSNEPAGKFTRRRVAVGAVSVVAAGVLAIPALASAGVMPSGGTAATTALPAQGAPSEGEDCGFGGHFGHRGHRGPHVGQLAETLGVEVEDLRTAMLAVRDVDGDGTLDRDAFESHDEFVAALAAELGISVEALAGALPDPAEQAAERLQPAADTLGIDVDTLQSAMEAVRGAGGEHEPGAFIAALAAELGVDVETLQEALPGPGGRRHGRPFRGAPFGGDIETLEARLADAVESGRITQERADEILAAAESGDPSSLRPQFDREPLTAEGLAERLQAAVDAGKMTRERADGILQAFEDGEFSGFQLRGRFGGPRGFDRGGFAPSGGV